MHNTEYVEKHLEAKQKIEKKLLSLKGVHGVSIGFKKVGGEITEDVSIVVHVFKKYHPSRLNDDENIVEIVKQIDPSLNVDVVESTQPVEDFQKTLKGQDILTFDETKYRPLKGGCKIMTEDTDGLSSIGTGGCIVTSKSIEGQTGILTNYHVVNESKNDVIYQPSVEIANKIGTVGNFAYSAKVDGAVIMLKDPTDCEAKIVIIGSIKGTKVPALNDIVQKYGYRTGLTQGKITNLAYSGMTDIGRNFTDQIIISKRNISDPRLSDNGDSGSAWVLETGNKVVALHWGGDINGCEAYASPINFVESELNVAVATE